jgi:hypothetical protein
MFQFIVSGQAAGSITFQLGSCVQNSDGGENTIVVAYILSEETVGTSATRMETKTETKAVSSSSSSSIGTSAVSASTSSLSKPTYRFTTYSDLNCSTVVYFTVGNFEECQTNPYTNFSGILIAKGNVFNNTYWLASDCNGKETVVSINNLRNGTRFD